FRRWRPASREPSGRHRPKADGRGYPRSQALTACSHPRPQATPLRSPLLEVSMVLPIKNPYVRDEITIDAAFSERVAAFAGDGSLSIPARRRIVPLQRGENVE